MTMSPRPFRITLSVGLFALLALVRPDAARAAETAAEILIRAREAFTQGRRDEGIALADQAVAVAPKDASVHFVRGRLLEAKRDFAAAIKAYDQTVELDPNNGGAYQVRGGAHFKLGHIEASIADFDRSIRLVPNSEAHNWQRALSYYYAGKFAEGKRQTELHQTVNPRDVENAAWHFACNARANGFDRARKELIPIAGDNRVPMREVHSLYAGLGSVRQVLEAAEAGKASDPERRGYRFYAHLYIGLYFEAKGDAQPAREHIGKAAVDFSQDHYMGEVARVHWQRMNQAKKTE